MNEDRYAYEADLCDVVQSVKRSRSERRSADLPRSQSGSDVQLWRIGEIASDEFDRWAAGSDTIEGERLSALARGLGWPTTASPSFLLLCFANFSYTEDRVRTCLALNRPAWVKGMLEHGAQTLSDYCAKLWTAVSADYERGGSAPLFTAFHRFVFVSMLMEQSALTEPRSMHRDAFMNLRRTQFGTLCRTVLTSRAKRCLIALMGQLSSFTMPFIHFLDDSGTRYLNLDQWMNFASFCRTISYPDMANYSPDDCWPCVLDDFVVWSRSRRCMTVEWAEGDEDDVASAV